jgi:hypothetical protein
MVPEVAPAWPAHTQSVSRRLRGTGTTTHTRRPKRRRNRPPRVAAFRLVAAFNRAPRWVRLRRELALSPEPSDGKWGRRQGHGRTLSLQCYAMLCQPRLRLTAKRASE